MGSRCTAHRRCCELDVMFERGGRFENDSENSGRMKLPSPEMGKDEEKEFDKRKKKDLYFLHTNLQLRLGICGGVEKAVGYIYWSLEQRRFREWLYRMETRSLRKSQEMQKQSLGVPTLEHERKDALGIRN